MPDYIIDVETRGMKGLITKLAKLKWITAVTNGGAYHQDRSYSQIWIRTQKSEAQIEDWLYKYCPPFASYVGVVQAKRELDLS